MPHVKYVQLYFGFSSRCNSHIFLFILYWLFALCHLLYLGQGVCSRCLLSISLILALVLCHWWVLLSDVGKTNNGKKSRGICLSGFDKYKQSFDAPLKATKEHWCIVKFTFCQDYLGHLLRLWYNDKCTSCTNTTWWSIENSMKRLGISNLMIDFFIGLFRFEFRWIPSFQSRNAFGVKVCSG